MQFIADPRFVSSRIRGPSVKPVWWPFSPWCWWWPLSFWHGDGFLFFLVLLVGFSLAGPSVLVLAQRGGGGGFCPLGGDVAVAGLLLEVVVASRPASGGGLSPHGGLSSCVW